MQEHAYGVMPVHFLDGEPRYLLLRQKSGHWSFPKGRGEEGETPLESALREFREETGLHQCLIFEEFPPISVHYHFRRDGESWDKHLLLFGAQVDNPNVQIQPEEITEYGWFRYSDAEKILNEFKRPVSLEALSVFHQFLSQQR